MQHAGDNAQTRPTSTTPRRSLFRGTAALLGAALLPALSPHEAHAAPVAGGDDAELVRLHEELVRVTDVIAAIEAEVTPGSGISAASLDKESRLDQANGDQDEVVNDIIYTQARSARAIRLKADALLLTLETEICLSNLTTLEHIEEYGEVHELLAWSLARDVLAMEG